MVIYSLGTPDVADLLSAARRILGTVLSDRDRVLAQLRNGQRS
jgi:hypothetical protein